jgi:hypothetical protein
VGLGALAVDLDRPPTARRDVAPEEERASVTGAAEGARDLDRADLALEMANGLDTNTPSAIHGSYTYTQ